MTLTSYEICLPILRWHVWPSQFLWCILLKVPSGHFTSKWIFVVIKERMHRADLWALSICQETSRFDIIWKRCLKYWIYSTIKGGHIRQLSFFFILSAQQWLIQAALSLLETTVVIWKPYLFTHFILNSKVGILCAGYIEVN